MSNQDEQARGSSDQRLHWTLPIRLTMDRALLFFLFGSLLYDLEKGFYWFNRALSFISFGLCVVFVAATLITRVRTFLEELGTAKEGYRGAIAEIVMGLTLIAYFISFFAACIAVIRDAPHTFQVVVPVGGIVLLLIVILVELPQFCTGLSRFSPLIKGRSIAQVVKQIVDGPVALIAKLIQTVVIPVLIGVLLSLTLTSLCPWIRRRVYECDQMHKEKWAAVVWARLGIVLMGSYVFIFSLPSIVVAFALDRTDWVLEAMAFGAFLVAFVALESPRLLKPNFLAVVLPSKDKGYEDTPSLRVKLKGGERNLMFFRLTNVGTVFANNCQCWFCFQEGFMPMESSDDLYSGIDFAKPYEVQKQNRCAKLTPNRSYLGVAPTNHIVFPLWICAPEKAGLYDVMVLVQSESNWGEFSRKLCVEVTEASGNS